MTDNDGSSKIVAVNREDVGDIFRSRGQFVCKEPHIINDYGIPMWDVISIKIRRNMKYHESEVRIHGAIRVNTADHFTDYLFKRKKSEAQVFEHPDEVLTLSLVGPHKPWVLEGFSFEPGLALYALLKYNDEDIFEMMPDVPPEYYTEYLKGCPDRYRKFDNGKWGDFEDYSDLFSENEDHVKPEDHSDLFSDNEDHVKPDNGKHLFSENEDHVKPVGFGSLYVSYISSSNLSTRTFGFDKILDKVASVEVELAHFSPGMVARLKVTSSCYLELYGEIYARSCLFKNGVVLFQKTQNEAMPVKPNESIQLSRSMAAVDCRADLVIKFHVKDAKDSNFLVDETIQFNILEKGCVSEKTTSNRVLSVKVEWTFESYEGPDFTFPGW